MKRLEKRNINFTTNIYLYIRVTDILKFYEYLFCTYYKHEGLFRL